MINIPQAFADPHSLLRKYGLAAKKSWGQNFLTSERVYRAIVDATVLGNDDWIVEVGSGLGTLTSRLAQRTPEGKVIAVEREEDMLRVLREELAHLENIEVHAANAMHYDFQKLAQWRGEKIAVCGNLPYQISSQILFRFLEQRAHITHSVAMIQKEMADRLLSSPGTKRYGAPTVLLSTYADLSKVIDAAPGCFTPAPKVDSTVIKMSFLDKPRVPIADEALYSELVHAAFAMRRKTLRNGLKARYGAEQTEAVLTSTGIDGTRRAETLSVAEFGALCAAMALAPKTEQSSPGPSPGKRAPKGPEGA